MHAGHGEVVVGGVFLRLLIKQPNWALRKPKDFLVAMLVFVATCTPIRSLRECVCVNLTGRVCAVRHKGDAQQRES